MAPRIPRCTRQLAPDRTLVQYRKAHELGKTKDWVVVYFHLDSEPESQCTVVTETRGPLAGRRVVRGREGECAGYYAEAPAITVPSPAGVGRTVKASH
jgi:hypothetical protein